MGDASADVAVVARRCAPWVEASAAAPEEVVPDAEGPRDRHSKPTHAKALCEVADSNLARADKAITAAPGVFGMDDEGTKRFADAKTASGSHGGRRGDCPSGAGGRGVRTVAHGVLPRRDVALADRDEPRVAHVAELVALAGLVERAHAVDDVARLDRAWTLFA